MKAPIFFSFSFLRQQMQYLFRALRLLTFVPPISHHCDVAYSNIIDYFLASNLFVIIDTDDPTHYEGLQVSFKPASA